MSDLAEGQEAFLADEALDCCIRVGVEPGGQLVCEPPKTSNGAETTFERIPSGPSSIATDLDT